VAAAVTTAVAATFLVGCGKSSPSASGSSGRIKVVAAENFWGSIAKQLGGDRADVTSIITNPDTDPHDYDASAGDARTVASAKYVIVNGIGYDGWASKLLGANPVKGRVVLTVGDLVGVKAGGNPHRWYSPSDVHQVIEQIVTDYKRLDPADATYFDARQSPFETATLARYDGLIATIQQRYAGTPVGASESIFTPMAAALKLDLLTPESFLDAIAEGSDPTAQDKATCDNQIKTHAIKVYVFNSQNSTPDVQAQVNEAKAAGIPVTSVTETLAPAGATFQDWQADQLQRLENALASATGR